MVSICCPQDVPQVMALKWVSEHGRLWEQGVLVRGRWVAVGWVGGRGVGARMRGMGCIRGRRFGKVDGREGMYHWLSGIQLRVWGGHQDGQEGHLEEDAVFKIYIHPLFKYFWMILPVLPVSELESGSDHMVSYLIGWGLSLHHWIENIAVCLISGKYLYSSILLHSKINQRRVISVHQFQFCRVASQK